MGNVKSVGLFLLLPAPLNPIGAFDAETFKADFRAAVAANSKAKFIGVDLSGLDFVYSDAYNAFMQFHQELSKRKGAFAVLADKESLAKSLRKVGLERFIRIFGSVDEMAAYTPVDQKNPTAVVDEPAKHVDEASSQANASQVESQPALKSPVVDPKVMDKNPLVDESSSSKGSCIAVLVLLLVVVAVVSYLVL